MEPRSKVWAEVEDGTGWVAISAADALRRNGDLMRCSQCHGQVRPRRKYMLASVPYFEHVRAHPGCPTHPTFYGRASLHPAALL